MTAMSIKHNCEGVGGRETENAADEQWFYGYGNRSNGTGSYYRTTSINEMMWIKGLAVKDDDSYPPRPDSGCSTAEGSGEDWTEGDSISNGTCDFGIGHTKTVLKEHLFTIGRSAQVVVSHIEGPGKFWCQLSQCVPSLQRLMEELQNHYVQSKPVQPSGPDCVVLHPHSSLWHRGRIVKLHSFPHVDVQLVDYGNTVRVTHQELRPLDSAFANLRCQAFQCRLVDATCPSKLPHPEWASSAVTEFCNFIHSAPASTMKCTIYGIMYDSEGTVNNLVDIASSSFTFVQSQSASASISQKDPKECSAPEMEEGSQEKVWITCVKDVHKFYGQLVRHSGEIEKLNEKIELFCRQPHGIKCSLSPGSPCFAKYSDGQWYRGQVKITHPVLLVHFLDYGDIIAVKPSDILPVPDEASYIMSFPVQAVEFNLSDVPVDTNSEVNRWFDNNATGQRFTVKVLEKYPDGKYTVELYDGKLNVNKAIKEKAQRTRQGPLTVLDHPSLPHGPSTAGEHKMSDLSAPFRGNDGMKQGSPTYRHDDRKTTPANNNVSKNGSISAIAPMSQKPEIRPYKPTMDDFSKTKPLGLPLRKTNDDTAMGATTNFCTTIHNLPLIEKPVSVKGNYVHSGPCSVSLPKLDDLPDQLITPDVETEVYVSHVNSPDSFFVQLVENEDQIHSLVEQLNVDQPSDYPVGVSTLQEGDVVVAIFPEDESWYRAVIKKVNNHSSVLVEFIDFGNEATITSNQMRCLEKSFLEVPKLCVHCCLYAGSSLLSAEELMIKLRETTADGEAKKMNCVFIKKFDVAWEIRLVDSDVAELKDQRSQDSAMMVL